MIKIIKTPFYGLKLINNIKYNDNRGYFREIIEEKKIQKKLPFAYISKSKKNVLRGLHLQTKNPQAKLITVLRGKVFDVAIDLRKNSKSYGKYYSIILSEKKNYSIYIPEGFAHGFVSMANNTLMLYQCSNYRNKKSEIGIKWNDKDLDIKWPKIKFILSSKDKNNLTFKEYLKRKF